MKRKRPRTEAELYADKYLRHGRPREGEEPRLRRFTLMLSESEYSMYAEAAREAGETMGAWIRKAVEERLKGGE